MRSHEVRLEIRSEGTSYVLERSVEAKDSHVAVAIVVAHLCRIVDADEIVDVSVRVGPCGPAETS